MRFIDGYTLDVCLHVGQIYTVWRGRRDTDLIPIVVKYINAGCVSAETSARLKREYEYFLKLKGTASPRTIDFLEHPEGPVFVLEDTGSKTLACEILRGPLDHKTFLHIATGLVCALQTLHSADLIHRTLTTSSILLDLKKVVRFGDLSGVFDRTNPATYSLPTDLLEHAEPCKIKNVPDYNDDYRALGYIFLSMLTGCSLPHQPSTAQRLLEGPDLPKSFVAIIKRLTIAPPEEGYTNLASVEADLQSCQDPKGLQSRTIVEQPSYRSPTSMRNAYIVEKLYGRSRELESLRQFGKDVENGEGQFVVICGPSGVGKTQLVLSAVHAPTRPLTPILHIVFGQKAHRAPYEAFVTAITDHIKSTLQQSEATFHTLRACIDAIPATELSVLCDFVLNLTLLAGRQPPPYKLPTHENKIRLFRSVLNLLEALTHPSRPLTVVFEDLHKADTSSLDLVQFILSESSFRHILFIGTLCEDKIGENGQITSLLGKGGKQGHMPPLMTLGALCVDDIILLLADMFNGSPPDIEDLAHTVTSYSGGNPFWALTTFHLWKAEKKSDLTAKYGHGLGRKRNSKS